MKQFLSVLLAAILCLSLWTGMTVAADVDTSMLGDVNGDAVVNAQDVAVLQRYLADWDVTVDLTAADLTGDGGVNNRDLATLQRRLSGWGVTPYITLPAIGTDIDLVNKKNRIRVSAASAAFADNGNIAVSLTFQNYNSRFITEESNWVEYTCYDADGNAVQGATKIYIGCIDTKDYKIKTFDFQVPANTAEVRLTNSKIVYWTEWA